MRTPLPAPPYAPFAEFRAPSLLEPVAAGALAAAAFGLWNDASRGGVRGARRAVALAAGGAAVFLLGRWLARRGRAFTRPIEQESPSVPDAHLERLLDEAVEETFPASDPIAVHIE